MFTYLLLKTNMAASLGCLFGILRREIYKTLPIVTNGFAREVRPLLLFGNQNVPSRSLSLSWRRLTEKQPDAEDGQPNGEAENEADADGAKETKSNLRRVVDVQTSMKYLKSKAYNLTYGDALVWQPYRRNHKGAKPPEKTRKTCVRGGVVTTGNPCPICRDEYLVLHPENVELLKQFLSPYTGQVESYQKTGICLKQHKNLLVAVQQAWDLGYIDMPVPFRQYDYEEYYPRLKKEKDASDA